MGITHAFVSAKPDGADTSKIQPSNWNAEHVFDDLEQNDYDGTEFHFREDWMYGGTNGTFYQAQAGGNPVNFGIYTTDWTTGAVIGGLTGTGRMGVVALQTSNQADIRTRVRTCAMGAFDSTKYSWISFDAVVAFSNKATVGDDFTAEIGLVGNKWLLTDSLGDVAGFMHAFRYKRSVGGHKWMAVNRDLDTETAVILDGTTQGGITTVDAGTIDDLSLPSYGFFHLKVIVYANPATGAGQRAEYWVKINNVWTLCATITTNMVTHSLAGSVDIRKTAGTNNRYIALDYSHLAYKLRDGQRREP